MKCINFKITMLFIIAIIFVAFSLSFAQGYKVTNVMINYGGTAQTVGGKKTITASMGQTAVGITSNRTKSVALGLWSFYLLEPKAPIVLVSDGDFPDRIEIKCYLDPLSPPADEGFKIYRDGSLLDMFEWNREAYQDFNIYAGQVYNYSVLGINEYGEGKLGEDVGFVSPNGIITGNIITPRGNPVADAEVFITPNLGKALSFDGVDDYIDVNDAVWFSGNFTVEGWVYLRSYNNWCRFIDFGNGMNSDNIVIALSEGTTGKVKFQIYNNTTSVMSITSPDAIPLNEWVHIACVLDGTKARIYKNGTVWVEGTATSGPRNIKRTNNYIGKSNWNSDAYTNAIFDDIRIWNVARTQQEIIKNMNRTVEESDVSKGLLAYWKFDEGMMDKIFDLTSNNNDGYIMNGAVWTDNKAPVKMSAFTNDKGDYAINGIYYGKGTTFTIVPTKEVPIGKALMLDGVNDYVDIPDTVWFNGNFTVESWVYMQSYKNWSRLIDFGNGPASDNVFIALSNGTTGKVNFSIYDGSTLVLSLDSPNPIPLNQWVHIACVLQGTSAKIYKNAVLWAEGTATSPPKNIVRTKNYIGRSNWSSDAYTNAIIDEVRIWNLARTQSSIEADMKYSLKGKETGLIGYWTFNDGSGSVVSDLTDNANNGIASDTTGWTDITPWDDKLAHIFVPENRRATLDPSNTSSDQIYFQDQSMVPVVGYVRHQDSDCFADSVEILVDGASANPPVYTKNGGKFTVEFEPGTSHKITPKYKDYRFIPMFYEVRNINRPVAGVIFNNTVKRKLTGKVVGGEIKGKPKKCKFPINQWTGKEAQVTLKSMTNCFEQTITTTNGNFTFDNLPPIRYTITVKHPDPGIIFEGREVSLVDSNRTIEFIHKEKIKVDITGLPTECVEGNNNAIKLTNKVVDGPVYTAIVKVYEQYGTGTDCLCPVDTGEITISNSIADLPDTTIAFKDSTGTFKFRFKAGGPNILGGGEHPYQKSLQVTVKDADKRTATKEIWAYVEGYKPREQTFVTSSPEIPLAIIRDPPGDQSYSYLSKTSEATTSHTISFSIGRNLNMTTKIILGQKFEGGSCLGPCGLKEILESEALLVFSLDIAFKHTSDFEFTNTITATENWQTSDNDAIIGPKGDIFIGGAWNIIYGITDVLKIDSCKVKLDKAIFMNPNGFKTFFIYTEGHIKDTLIPQLEFLKSKQIKPDSIAFFDAQIKSWEKILAMNDSLKAKAEFVKNISFSAGTSYDASDEYTSNFTYTVSHEISIDMGIAIEYQAKILGVGSRNEARTSFSITVGHSFSTSTTNKTVTGYHLADDDPGDYYSVDILKDPVYGTPVFKTVAGRSSCPWEVGTQPRDGVQLTVSPRIAVNVPPDESAVFTLALGNTSQSDEEREYLLSVNQASNPQGAQISINGVPLESAMSFTIPPGQQINAVMTVKRGPKTLDYENLEVQLTSACDPNISTSTTFTIHFLPPCTEVRLADPDNNWVMTKSNGDTLLATITGYNLLEENLKLLKLQYRQLPNASPSELRIQNEEFRIKNSELGMKNIPQSAIKNPKFLDSPMSIRAYQSIVSSDTLLSVLDYNTLLPNEVKEKMTNNESIDVSLMGESDWILVPGSVTPKDNLKNTYIQIPWNIKWNSDGRYEIRAVAECYGGVLPYRSVPMMGIIDRNGPRKLANPSPVDGVLDADDIISITFDERINCLKINPVDDVKLVDTERGDVIDIDFVCSDKIITFTPNFQNQYIENRVLRATVANIEDIYGNKMEKPISWEFYVNKNPIMWVGGEIDVVKYLNEPLSITRTLANEGGGTSTFTIAEFASWITPSIINGDVPPKSSRTITFDIRQDLPPGNYVDTLYANTTNGNEPLVVKLRVLCQPPEWKVSTEKYEYTMSITANLYIDNQVSNDKYDMIGVFVGDELRGVGNVQFVPELNLYEIFLNIYSNQASGEVLSFRVWDASECIELKANLENAYPSTYQANVRYGSPINPAKITATQEAFQQIEFPSGIKWFSLNLQPANMSVNSVLSSLSPSDGDIIKGQTSFAQYSNASKSWVGTLTTLDNKAMYIMKLAKADTLQLIGNIINPASNPISIAEGWNWIGYLPHFSMSVNTALSSLNATVTHGDVVKSQIGYSQYVSRSGWIGNMLFMSPEIGYQLYSQNAGTLTYPPKPSVKAIPSIDTRLIVENAPDWSVRPNDYQYNMVMTGTINGKSVDSTDVIGAFINDECRGIAQPIYIPSLNRYYIFIMVYSNNAEKDNIKFQFIDSKDGKIIPISNTIDFKADEVLGSVSKPFEWIIPTRTSIGIDIPVKYSLNQNFPNPFNPLTQIRYDLPEDAEVNIVVYNVLGQKVRTLVSEKQTAGYRFVLWNGKDDNGNDVSSGIYFYRMTAGEFKDMKKMVLLK